MKIDRNLNIVIPVDLDGGGKVFVHSMPISRDVFERYFLPISRAYSMMMMQKLTSFGALKVAKLLLRKSAQEMGEWDGEGGVAHGLFPEIRRLTNVLMPSAAGGWQTLPFEEVISRQLFDETDIEDVENILVFFMLASAMSRRRDLRTILEIASAVWDAQITSSSCTEFGNSLPTSTGGASTGVTAGPSSIPY